MPSTGSTTRPGIVSGWERDTEELARLSVVTVYWEHVSDGAKVASVTRVAQYLQAYRMCPVM